MSQTRRISRTDIDRWFEKIGASGRRIFAPKKKEHGVDFDLVQAGGEIAWEAVQTVQSPKFLLFPKAEELFRFQPHGEEIGITEPKPMPPTVIFGQRPCDAAGILALETIFHWDGADPMMKARREALTLASISCRKADDFCFCTSVGGGPGEAQGSDLLLTETTDGHYLVEILTAKGEALVGEASDLFQDGDEREKGSFLAQVPAFFDAAKFSRNCAALFDHEDKWQEQSLRCIGCGACAYVCPACACFDIQDEGTNRRGRRVRCWDSCGFSLFTLHASGHNPRERQFERWRQRIMHKFSYEPDRLQVLGCVGCGRCSRACPVDMNIREHLQSLAEELP